MSLISTSRKSSWIQEVGYISTPAGGFLAIFTDKGTAILYQNVPSHVAGLVVAGRKNLKDASRRSVGATYCELVKGKYVSQTIDDPKEVQELRELSEKERRT